MGWTNVHGCIPKANTPSIGLAEKLGAILEREEHRPAAAPF
ncbi:MAG: hypothetical protein AAGL96_11140 [Pseudomonadota bacterium]